MRRDGEQKEKERRHGVENLDSSKDINPTREKEGTDKDLHEQIETSINNTITSVRNRAS